MFGLLNIDKPAGMTSRDVVDCVVPLVKPDKVGHAGTLDPLATGVLVLCIGRATRLVPYVQAQPKCYRAGFRFGLTSDTDDIDGDVCEIANAPEVTLQRIQDSLPAFTGSIEQSPPRFSAVKIKGRRAHDLARRGKPVDLAPRSVEVHRLDVVEFSSPDLTLDVECGSGTYVRAIGRDLGQALGTGAVMTRLRRTCVGVFDERASVALNKLDRETLDRELLPASLALAGYPFRVTNDADRTRLRHGRPVALGDTRLVDGPSGSGNHEARLSDRLREHAETAIVDEDGALIAIATENDGWLLPRQVFG